MDKPQNLNKCEFFSDGLKRMVEHLDESLSELQKEDLQLIIERAYKEGVLDGFLDAVFYMDY